MEDNYVFESKDGKCWYVKPFKINITFKWFGLVLWCLTPLSTIFQLYRGGQFYW